MVDLSVSRRDFLRSAAVTGAAVPLMDSVHSGAAERLADLADPSAADVKNSRIDWLDRTAPSTQEGQTFGVPWPRGVHARGTQFALHADNGASVPAQSWVTAWWPDGSIKWTAHALPAGRGPAASYRIVKGTPGKPSAPVTVREQSSGITVQNGPVTWQISRSGPHIITSARHGDRETLRDVRLIAHAQDRPDFEDGQPVTRQEFVSEVLSATIEQDGPVRAVVKIDGRHRGHGRDWLPFCLRLYFYAGSEAVRVVHSFIFDGDPAKDFLGGLGLSGTVPMSDLPHDRHVRFAGEGQGLWAEAVRPLTGLRRDTGKAFRDAQIEGKKTPPLDQMAPKVRELLPYIPQWGDFRLSQPNADGFSIIKRTSPGHGWIDADTAHRAQGLGYVGGAAGGVAFGLADFWQRCPVALDIANAQGDAASFTLWYHSPYAAPMDLRFFHDVMGMDDYVHQNLGLDITYEDYEPGWGDAHGIGRTTEFTLWALPATPSRARLVEMANGIAKPPRLICAPARVHAARVFGDWSLVDRSSPARRRIEDQNDYLLDYYQKQIEQHRWYGFWNYGDVMHTYDVDRHVWRYDIGGFAWDNSELSTDLWLWYSYLRSGRADVFRMAEAMTRHTGEVDVYHIGRFKGLGTRHGVQHWGDSSKQPRVSNAAYRRIYYYLTADERVGDLMHALIDSDYTLQHVRIERKVGARAPASLPPGGTSAVMTKAALPQGQVFLSFGTSWGSLIAAWQTEWERTGDTRWRDRIVNGMQSIAALKKQWFAGGAPFDLKTGRFLGPGDKVSVSHLNAVFGIVSTQSELFELLDVPEYKKAWLDYCVAYNAPPELFRSMTGAQPKGRNLKEGHSRLTAYAAAQRHDAALARRAWQEFEGGEAGLGLGIPQENRTVTGPAVLKPVDEAPHVSTNATAQWGLAAIQNLALIGEFVDDVLTD